MMISNSFGLIFAVAFMGCVLVTPLVTRVAVWAGAIDRPDQFRRIHKGATPRLGGLGLAAGLLAGLLLVAFGGIVDYGLELSVWWAKQWSILLAGLMVLGVGFVDDTRGLGPRVKLLGQAAAVLVLYVGGIRIDGVDILGYSLNFTHPSFEAQFLGWSIHLAPVSLMCTMFWFLGCMNVWNLIDGMDGLASGVGLLVCGTLTLVAIHNNNTGAAVMASALAGSLAGFLLYNWHPACIFLGDSGSLLIGLLIGVIGVQGCLKGPSAISILFPILAMGLPISDTAMAIFRRWVRNLPLSSADRKHVHHLLIGFGLNPRQAALLLYCFTGFFCGVVLLGVRLRSQGLALILGLSGCLAFLIILMSRRDELANLRGDLAARMVRKRQERFAAKVTWEAIQRVELCDKVESIYAILLETSVKLGCDRIRLEYTLGEQVREQWDSRGDAPEGAVSGASAVFRLSSGQSLSLTVSVHQAKDSNLAADIAFRFLQRLSLTTVECLDRLLTEAAVETVVAGTGGELADDAGPEGHDARSEAVPATVLAPSLLSCARGAIHGVRILLGWQTRPVAPRPSLISKE